MATPPQNDDTTRINAPLNFRHSNSLITTKVPHNPTKVDTGMSIIPGWNRPNANGQNSNINDKDYNGPDFKARPLKHWRHQLRVYNYNGPANNSRTASISDIERPGTTVYHFTPDCTCVTGEGGNSYIISNNQFGYETKDDNYSKITDVQIQNNGYSVVPYDATVAQINDPTNPAYKILTGVYNTNCINCSPEGNIIKSGIALQNEAYHSYSRDKLNSRCQTYEQNISTNKAPGGVYFDAQGIPLWPNDSPNGPQVFSPINFEKLRLYNKPCISQTIYKPSNVGFAKQGAVSGSTRLKKLVSDTMTMNGSSFYSARGATEANLGRYQGTSLSSNYYVKTKPVVDSCRGTTPTPPIIRVVDRDTYSITFSWQDFGNSFCNVVYYTVTYFAINIVETLRNVDDSQYFFNSSEDVEGVEGVEYVEDVEGVEGVEDVEDVMDIQDFFDNNNNNQMVLYNNENMVMGARNSTLNSDGTYTDTKNNIRYTIISTIRTMDVASSTTNPLNIANIGEIVELKSNTPYLMRMTSTNGNGTSILSNAVLATTLLDSNIVISIEPLTIESGDNYVYPYTSSIPITLTIKVSSDHTTTPIILSIVNASNTNLTNSDAATLTPIEGSTYELELRNAGTFNLQGRQARGLGEFINFGNSKTISPLLTITQATPVFSTPWNISRSNVLLIGRTYPFFPVNIISSVQLDGEYKIIDIYGNESNNATFINSYGVESNTTKFIDNFVGGNTQILIKSYGIFRIRATTVGTQNYKSISTTSRNIYASRNDPIIEFEFPNAESFNRRFTYRTGQTYDIDEINAAIFITEPQDELRIIYSAISVETDTVETYTVSDVVDIDTRTVTIKNAGSFRIRARTNQTAIYNSVEIFSPPITIDKATPTFSEPWYLFEDVDTVLFVNRTYNFSPPAFTFPYPGPLFPSDSISITSYTSSNTFIARLDGSPTTIRIVGEGLLTITARTSESRNYKQVEITSEVIEPTSNTARVAFSRSLQTSITYSEEEYFLGDARFIFPRDVYNFEGSASLSGSRIVVSEEQYNFFIIGRRVTANITGTTSPPITSIDDTITDKKIEYISAGLTRHVIYIRNDTRISASTPATIINIIQYISDPRDFYITYSIVSDKGYASDDVARISGSTLIPNIRLQKAGTFKIRAHTNQINPQSTIRNSTRDSRLITVNKATPVLRLNDLFPYTLTLQVKNPIPYEFGKAIIESPVTIPNEILPITYISLNTNIVTIETSQPTASQRPSLRVVSVGSFRIRAETKASDRYNIGYAESPEEFSTNPGMPLIEFDPSQNFGPFTYRTNPSFTILDVRFRNPLLPPSEINVSYNITETNIVSLEDRTVTINNAGEFTLRVKTIPSENFNASNLLYKNIIVKKFTPEFQQGWRAFTNLEDVNVDYVFVSQTFEITPPTIIVPDPNEDNFPSEILSFQYRIEPEGIAEIVTISETSTIVRVLKESGFYIYAYTPNDNKNYETVNVKSRKIYGAIRERPIIVFPNKTIQIEYGNVLEENDLEAVFRYPAPIINIDGSFTLSITSNETRIILENSQQYNKIVIGAYLRVTTTSSNIVNFIVVSRMIQTGQFIVVVERHSGEILDIGNYTVQSMTQELRIPVGGSIAYSILPNPPYRAVAEISDTIVTEDNRVIPVVTIKRAGSFTIQAVATVTTNPPTFTNSSYTISSTVNVTKATPTIEFDNPDLFPTENNVLLTNRRYNFTPARVTIPTSDSSIYEKLEIVYRSYPLGVVTIFPLDVSSNTIPIRVNRAEKFRIIAQTIGNGNFNMSADISSNYIDSAQENTPVLFFPGPGVIDENGDIPVTNLTYGFTNSTGVRNTYNVEQLAQLRYPYDDNIPTDLIINYSINSESSNIARVEMKSITVEDEGQEPDTINAPVITILRAGLFTLIAQTNPGRFTLIGYTEPTVQLNGSRPISRRFNVKKATPTFETWDVFNEQILLTGTTVEFRAPVFTSPEPGETFPSEILPFTYQSFTSSDPRIITIEPQTRIEDGVTIFTARIHKVGPFTITARIEESTNYTQAYAISEVEEGIIVQNRPVIVFPGENRSQPSEPESDFITQITYGETYTLREAFFQHPLAADIERFRLSITYTIVDASDNTPTSTVASIDGTIVTIHSAGTFRIQAKTNNTNEFGTISTTSPSGVVTVLPATPTISFTPTFRDIFNPTLGDIQAFFVNNQYTFQPATITGPSTVPLGELTITYKPGNENVEVDGTATTIRIIGDGPIVIVASTGATTNFLPGTATYTSVRVTQINKPGILVPSIVGFPSNEITLGRDYTLQASTFYHPLPNDVVRFGLSIQHRIVDASDNIVTSDVATINGTTITLNGTGRFKIRAESIEAPPNGGQSIFIRREVFSPVINVIRATPGIAFPNNNNLTSPNGVLFSEQILLVNGEYEFTPAVVTIPAGIRNETLTVVYTSEPENAVNILFSPLRIQVNTRGRFVIRATTLETNIFDINSKPSNGVYGILLNTPILEFRNTLGNIIISTDTFTFGTINPNTTINPNRNINIYTPPRPAIFAYPSPTLNIPITYSIPPDLNTAGAEVINENNQNPAVRISRVGNFTLTATTTATMVGTVSYVSVPVSIIVTVQRGTPTFERPWNLGYTSPLVTGTIVNFRVPRFLTPNPLPTEIPDFTVSSFTILPLSSDTDTTRPVATILSGPVTVNSVTVFSVRINRLGAFYIRATTAQSANYNGVPYFYSSRVTVNTINTPRIIFPRPPADLLPVPQITFGDTYTVVPAYFQNPTPLLAGEFNLNITHSITISRDFILSIPDPSMNFTQTVSIGGAGTFTIYAQSTPILNSFNASIRIHFGVTVNLARPTITFPGNIFPASVSVLIVGTSYDFLPAVVTVRGITDATILPQIRYKTNDDSVATIEPTRRRITIRKRSTVPIQIIAYTQATTNFTAAQAEYSNQRSVYYNTPVIRAPLVNNILTFGQQPQPTFERSVVTNPAYDSSFNTVISNNIVYAIVDETENNTLRNNIATISGTTITLLRSGRFRIRATTTPTNIFTSASMWSTVVTVNRARPEFQTTPWNPIPPILFLRDTATITPPVFRFPLPVPPEILNITYGYISLPTHIRPSTRIITITPATQPEPPAAPVQTSVRIESAGRFIITATTRKSLRYEQVTFRSSELQASHPRTPVINFPTSGFTSTVIFGVQPYQLNQAVFTYPSPTPSGVTISYSITRELQFPSDPRNVNNVANIINGTTIRINNVGHFYILARTNPTNAFNVAERRSPRVTVTPAATTLQTTRWNAFPNITTPITLFVDQPLTIAAPSFQSPSEDERRINGIRIVYFINNATTYINGPSFTVQAAGTLVVRAETRSNLNSNYSNARSINSGHITITFINRPPPRIVMHNEVTLAFQERSIPQSPDFIQASPRGSLEWFAVVDQRSFQQIRNYARGTDTTTFRGVPFNNIVTTLMTDMSFLFDGSPFFNQTIESWDTGNVRNMAVMFRGCTNFNQRLHVWNTAQVLNMNSMFTDASNFNNGGFDSMPWNTMRVTNMSQMFNNAIRFNSRITHWNTVAVTDMSFMFIGATAFNRWISWNTSSVTVMASMFTSATSLNDHIELNTQSVTNMNGMFSSAISFRGLGYIGGWDTSRVTQMRNMFNGCSNFNRTIGSNGNSWRVGSVLNMTGMFDGATSFNQPINNWNTNSVTDMSFMFRNARNFNQNIGAWDTSRVTNMQHMFDGATAFNWGFPCRATFIQTGHNSFLIGRWFWDVRSLGVNGSNFMFNNATCFVTNINSWVVPINSGGIGFRRNSGLEDRFTPPNILNRAPNGGR